MQILVDADACPVKDIIVKVARQNNLPVTMLIDTSHELSDGYGRIITVDKARDSVDIALINLVKAGDIVVTQDYGVAAMALGKKARALNQNGMIFSDDNIDRLLFERHLGSKVRRAGGRTSNPPKRKREDDESFERSLRRLVESYIM
ncbi:MAG TPA: YaiI/YqxD family protein [Clostridia bacterium]|nr:YaiI/YqxD family protein [Clostridia bacterium]